MKTDGVEDSGIVLASASPRRRELLRAAGWTFEVRAAEVEELPHEGSTLPLADLTMENASRKARAVAGSEAGRICLGADTLVSLDGRALGKPRSMEEAVAMLESLSGRSHVVCTGVCLALAPARGDSEARDTATEPEIREHRFHEITTVTFQRLTAERIRAYLAEVNPLDKAGAYGAQERGDLIIERIEGSFENVVGLPVARLREAIEAFLGVESETVGTPQ